jgi:hypothetical protein
MRKGPVPSPCRFRLLAVASLVVVLAPASGRAQDDAQKQVDAIIKKAVELRRQGNDRDALTELQRATSIANPPRLTAQIGLAEQALGLWVASDKHLRQALEQASDPWIKKSRRLLDESLATVDAHLGSLDVWGQPEGAEVVIDGDVAGTLPLAAPLKLQAGTVELTVRAAHFLPATRKLEISSGANVREHVVLRAVPVVTQAVAPDSGPQPAVAVTPTPDRTPSDDDDHGSVFTRWWFWTIAAAVVAGGVTAVVLATRKPSGCDATTCSTF